MDWCCNYTNATACAAQRQELPRLPVVHRRQQLDQAQGGGLSLAASIAARALSRWIQIQMVAMLMKLVTTRA